MSCTTRAYATIHNSFRHDKDASSDAASLYVQNIPALSKGAEPQLLTMLHSFLAKFRRDCEIESKMLLCRLCGGSHHHQPLQPFRRNK